MLCLISKHSWGHVMHSDTQTCVSEIVVSLGLYDKTGSFKSTCSKFLLNAAGRGC